MSRMEILRHGCGETTEPSLVSQREEPINKLDLDSSEQPGGKCSHFSIRGYTASTRRSNKKICWPFTFTNKYNLDKSENLLPPINVAEFKWWNCENCLRLVGATSSVENGVVMKNLSDEGATKRIDFDGSSVAVSNAKASAHRTSQVASAVTLPEMQSAELNNKLIIESDRSNLLLCGGSNHNDGLDSPKENQVQIENRSGHDIITDEPCKENAVSRLKRSHPFSKLSTSGNADPMAMFCDGSALENINITSRGTELVCKVTDASTRNEVLISRNCTCPVFRKEDDEWPMKNNLEKMKNADHIGEEHSLAALDVHSQKNTACTSGSVLIPEDDSMELEFQGYGITKKSDNAVGNEDKSPYINGLGVSGGSLKRKKVQKMRMLSDIMKSEVSGVARQISTFVPEEASTIEANNTAKPDERNMENLLTGYRPNVTQEKQGPDTNNKKMYELPEVEDASSLMHWLKRKPKKVKAFKVDSESKYHHAPDLDSKSKRDSSKIPSSRNSGPATSQGNNMKILKVEKRSKNGQQDYMQKHRTDAKDHCIIDDGSKIKSRNTSLTTVLPCEVNENLYRGPIIHGRSHKKSNMNNQQKNTAQVEDEGHSDIHGTKESVGMLKDKVDRDSRRYEKVSKKQTAQIANHRGDTPAVDDIPLEILKLLQDNWHKRHADEHSTESMGISSKIDKDMINRKIVERTLSSTDEVPSEQHKHQKPQVSLAKTDCLREVVLSAHLKNKQEHTFLRNTLGNNFHTAGKSARNASDELNFGYCDKDKGCNSRDINEQGSYPVSAGLSEPSYSMKKPRGSLELPTFSNNGCCPQNHRLVIENMNSHDKVLTSVQNSCRNDPVSQSTMPFRSTPFGIRDFHSPKILPCVAVKKNMLSIDSSMKRKRLTGDSGVLIAANSASIQQQKMKQMVGLKSNEETLPTIKLCSVSARNECNTSMMRPLDLHTNETISAMNLLRLMDPAVCSKSPLCGATDKAQINFHQQSDISYNYQHQASFGLGAKNGGIGETKHPQVLENIFQSHLSGNSSNLYVPLPRIGVHVPYCSEGAPNFNNSKTPFSSVGRDQDGVYSFFPNYRGMVNHSPPQSTFVSKLSSLRDQNEQVIPTLNYGSQTMPFHRVEQMVNVNQMNKTDEVHLLKRSCRIEVCVVNRNPADFTAPGENNEYMTGYENLQPLGSSLRRERQPRTHLVNQRKQRSVNLISPKVLLRN